ncbi:MAG: class I SAM-dependent methyltransferase [Candidatus Roizmanbacteria bacterium]|nr:class I SAM-dependent methyltransferase [Candidatus Roizmanbacteria bacterium]
MANFYTQFIDEKMKVLSQGSYVLDIGGGERFQKWLAKYKELFTHCRYETMDYDVNSGANVIGDIHNIPLDDNSVDSIICHCVLEHVRDPIRAVEELLRILKSGGHVFVHVPSIYPYHARKGHYPDYWRFFDETLEMLFKDFSHIEMVKRGGYFKALFFFIPFQHRLRWVLDPLAQSLDTLFRTERRTTTSGYYLFATK